MYKKFYIDPAVQLNYETDPLSGFDIWLQSKRSVVKTSDELVTIGTRTISIHDYFDEIMDMNMQYNNIPYFVFEVTGSILFRDILYNINKTSQWAESLRLKHSVINQHDPSNFKISSEYKGIEEWDKAFDEYFEAVQSESRVDKNRVTMPFSLSSTYWIGMNLKTLISFLSMLKYRMPFFYMKYGILFERVINDEFRLRSPFLDDFDITKYYSPELDSGFQKYFNVTETRDQCIQMGDYVYLTQKMGMVLYSQFIRQADTDIAGLYDVISHTDINEFKHKVFTGSSTFYVRYVAHMDRVKKTIGDRICWISQSDGDESDPRYWSKFINTFIHGIGLEEFKKLLPCKFYKNKVIGCKFAKDIEFRDQKLQKGYIPCGIKNHSKEYCKQRLELCNNNLNNMYSKVVNSIDSECFNYNVEFKAWTSELTINTSCRLSNTDIQYINTVLSNLENIWNKSMKIDDSDNSYAVLKKYLSYGKGDDITCMMKGLAIDIISEYLSESNESYLINFGGDIYAHNVNTKVKIRESKFYLDMSGDWSVFTSGNLDSNRGKHIVRYDGSTPDIASTVVIRWNPTESKKCKEKNILADILATKTVAVEVDKYLIIEISRFGVIDVFNFDKDWRIINQVYCASPFFNKEQVSIRDKMVSAFVNPFRPDLTKSSKRYDKGEDDAVDDVVDDNIKGINNSYALVFPYRTTDIGTLFEVGYALSIFSPIIEYFDKEDKYIIKFIEIEDFQINNDKRYVVDCSTKRGAILMGRLMRSHKHPNNIYYTLNGAKDNIMVSQLFKHVELKDGKYVLVKRNKNERDK
jgi:nucleoside 2-deoxyribosyltransferase